MLRKFCMLIIKCQIPVSVKLGKFLPLRGIALVAHHQVLNVIDIHMIRLEGLVQRIYKFLQGGNFLSPEFLPVLDKTRRFSAWLVVQSVLSVANLHFSASTLSQHLDDSIQSTKVSFCFPGGTWRDVLSHTARRLLKHRKAVSVKTRALTRRAWPVERNADSKAKGKQEIYTGVFSLYTPSTNCTNVLIRTTSLSLLAYSRHRSSTTRVQHLICSTRCPLLHPIFRAASTFRELLAQQGTFQLSSMKRLKLDLLRFFESCWKGKRKEY